MSIQRIYDELSDDDLTTCLVEIMIMERTGVLGVGKCRQVAQEVERFTTDFYPIQHVINSLHREAATRWLAGRVHDNQITS